MFYPFLRHFAKADVQIVVAVLQPDGMHAAKLQYGEERRNDLTARAAAAEQRAEFLHAAHQQLLEHLCALFVTGYGSTPTIP